MLRHHQREGDVARRTLETNGLDLERWSGWRTVRAGRVSRRQASRLGAEEPAGFSAGVSAGIGDSPARCAWGLRTAGPSREPVPPASA